MNLKGYVSVRIPVPVSVQNLLLRDYCQRNNHEYSLADVEFVTGYHMLQGAVGYDAFDGICAYSMDIFPEDEAERDLILLAAEEGGLEIHYALENYVWPRDKAICEEIWKLKALVS